MATALPIDPLVPEILSELKRSANLVVIAPPGAGKTTRVPPALLLANLAGDREILVLQPRRLPTRLAARRVAEELGETLGNRIGYQIRFEDVGGPSTRLRFVTEGVLERRLFSEPLIPSVGVVVLDEFHERHLSADLGLALLRKLQQTHRPDLKLLVMSATLDAEPVAAFLGGSRILRSEGRPFQVELEHLSAPDHRPLEQQVLAALKRLGPQGEGDALVFLPGAAEIRRSIQSCEQYADRHGLELHALHGDLSAEEQDRAIRPSTRRKVILSTNVAETSVTIEGLTAVIDSGLARIGSHSPWSGLPALKLAKVSKASAAQRAGRAGRTRPGRCLRLYTRQDFDSRPDHETPEIQRMDLASAVLGLHALGVRNVAQFPFLETPPSAALDAAESLLRRLGALDAAGDVTDLGRRLVQLPIHPRLGSLILDGEKRRIGWEAVLVAALLSERDNRASPLTVKNSPGPSRASSSGSPSDLLELLEGFDPKAARGSDRVSKQLARTLRLDRRRSAVAIEDPLLRATLSAFPDRVGKRRSVASNEVLLSEGGTALLDPGSAVSSEFLVAVDAEERTNGQRKATWIRLASKVEPEWLLELPNNNVTEFQGLEWNADLERVERVERLCFGKIVLDQARKVAPPGPETAKLLYKMASAEQAKIFDLLAVQAWKQRLAFVSEHFPDAGFPEREADPWDLALRQLCEGASGYQELRATNPLTALGSMLSADQSRLLTTQAPERIALPSGRQLQVHYEPGKPPWVQSRLQDFFGMRQGPAIAGGRVPLVLHLLAPNQRPVQVTDDLAGFWQRHYPAIRRQLARKYPRHAWPENPLQAAPPPARARR